jgi:hypothetical protein
VEFGSEAVAFATLAMVLMGCSTAILIPIIFACSEHRTNESRLARPKASIQSFSARSGSGVGSALRQVRFRSYGGVKAVSRDYGAAQAEFGPTQLYRASNALIQVSGQGCDQRRALGRTRRLLGLPGMAAIGARAKARCGADSDELGYTLGKVDHFVLLTRRR